MLAVSKFAIGLMTGTSIDGIDAALIEVVERSRLSFPEIKVANTLSVPFNSSQRNQILDVCSPDASVFAMGRVHVQLGQWLGDAVNQLIGAAGIPRESIAVIGMHGQTVAHYPSSESEIPGFTIQIGDAATLAARTGIGVVSQFRAMDMAFGGQGAPLVPYFDYAVLHSHEQDRVSLNIGGVANITVLSQGNELEDVMGFDTGPGNMVLDGMMELVTNGTAKYDKDGGLAGAGRANSKLVETWMTHPFFHRNPPKSTGREEFGRDYCRCLYQQMKSVSLDPADMLATVTDFVAESIAHGIQQVQAKPFVLIAAGGGIHNTTLMNNLARKLNLVNRWSSSDVFGIPSDFKEAIAFAYFAWQFLKGRPTNLPKVTGASQRVLQGMWTPAQKTGNAL
ncbi:anhydro-N-acetylmuramic acid kinase [Sulfobacillus thermotolerans]|uniref:Anhydro-N-acetylmuramic acid kinase n=1 Tax=Sulfobacillus thermotolerans TaxID=338644 RepID=A0ABM6RNX5_9FIRM|nr:anhydro-N-acetylmuramic acid kinase [Sulfobacillus thermotolerans]